MTTGEIIQTKRKQRGWSQDQLAEKLNISRQSISKWEQDAAMPDLENGLKLCETLGITVEELLHPSSTANLPNNPTSENSFISAEKFIKKKGHYAGLIFALGGLGMSVAGALFKNIVKSMAGQAQTQWDGMFGGMFPSIQTSSPLLPFIDIVIMLGIIAIIIGSSIFLYGKYRKKTA